MKRILSFILLVCVLFVSGCADSDSSRTVKTGDYVSVNYTGSLDDGTVFDTSMEEVAREKGIYNPYRKYEPLSFIVGSGQMIAGFDEAVMGMAVGESKTVTIPSEDAYGEVMDELFVPFTMEEFISANITPVIGEQITSRGYEGTIVNITEDTVVVDFNHKFAGKDLIFFIELVSIQDA